MPDMERRPGPEDASTSNINPPTTPFRTPRVSQIDSDELDEGLVEMLGEKVGKSIGNFRKGLFEDYKPEINLILKIILFRLSYGNVKIQASPGAKLQNLKLIHDSTSSKPPERSQFISTSSPGNSIADDRFRIVSRKILLLYLLLHAPIFPNYLLTRIRNYALSNQWPDLPSFDWRRKIWRGIIRIENFSRVWELAGWGWFLWDGKYPSLVMRFLKIRLIPASNQLTRLVSYEFMNRQLVWSALTEFLMFSIPLLPNLPVQLSPSTFLNPIRSTFTQPTSIDYTSIPLLPSIPSSSSTKIPSSRLAHSGPLSHLDPDICPICYNRQRSSSKPIDTTGVGASISLPQISGQGDDLDIEECKVFVEAQSDCWGECKWCYYCIGESLVRYQEELEIKRKKNMGKVVKGEKGQDKGDDRWDCLRCGGKVSKAWRVGPDSSSSQGEVSNSNHLESEPDPQ